MKPLRGRVLLPAAILGATLSASIVLTSSADLTHCVPPPSGMVSWWRGEGNCLDAVGTNNGTLQNGATFTVGRVGQSFAFDGVRDYVKIPKSPTLDVGGQVTVEFWMKADPDTPIASRTQGLVTSDFYGIEIGGVGENNVGIEFFTSTDGGVNFAHTSDPNGHGAIFPTGEWHHVAGTYDGANMQLYIDGLPWGQPRFQANRLSPMLAHSFVAIGSEDGRTTCWSCMNRRYFKGLIDEVAIFNRALSAGEIAAIYNAGAAGKCQRADPPSIVSPPLSYQPPKAGVPGGNAIGSSLGLTNLQIAEVGNHAVAVSNSIGSANGSNAYPTTNPAGVSLALYSGITIEGVVGSTYGVQYSTDLSNPNGWRGIANVTLSAPAEVWFDLDPANQPQRYYRVVPGPIAIP